MQLSVEIVTQHIGNITYEIGLWFATVILVVLSVRLHKV